MTSFCVGQRVRIKCPDSPRHGCEATVTSELYATDSYKNRVGKETWIHDACVDGWGEGDGEAWFAYTPDMLEPLTPTPSAEDILKLKGLPDFECPAFDLLTLESPGGRFEKERT